MFASAAGRLFVTLFLIGVITGCIVVTAMVIYVMNFMETDTGVNLDNLSLSKTTIFYATDENGIQTEVYRMSLEENRIEVSLDQIPQHVIDAFVCTEDKRFYEHEGVDWVRTASVTINAVFRGGTQGGSTITQQLIKNATSDDDITPVRKLREIFRALQLEKEYSKDEILEKYLNIIFLGGRNYGIEAAAQSYFGCHVWDLTVDQAACLAGMTRSPNNWRPDLHPDKNKERRDYALKCMWEQGKLTDDQYEYYTSLPIVTTDEGVSDDEGLTTTTQTAQGITSYYTDAVIEEVISDLMDENGWSYEFATEKLKTEGYRIYMNVDSRLQKIVEEKFMEWQTFSKVELTPNENDEYPEAAFVLMDYQGTVLALVGGKGEKTLSRSYNRATQAPRSPGSCMKPIAVYSPALEYDLIEWSSVLLDGPAMELNDKPWPNNYSGTYSGDVTVVSALRQSLNTIPVKLILQLTPERSVEFMQKKFGITTLVTGIGNNDFGPAITLGSLTKGIYLEELTAAYAAFGNGGLYYTPATYSRIESSTGDVVYDNQPTKTRAISEDTASIMNRLLRQVVIGPQGTGHAADMGSMEVVGKTGTSDDYKDRSFVGLTPYYVGGFWTGYDTPAELPEALLNSPDKVWNTIMTEIHAGLEAKTFELTGNVVQMEFCTESGMAVSSGCTKTEVGYFKQNALPAPCDLPHGAADDDKKTSSAAD